MHGFPFTDESSDCATMICVVPRCDWPPGLPVVWATESLPKATPDIEYRGTLFKRSWGRTCSNAAVRKQLKNGTAPLSPPWYLPKSHVYTRPFA